MAIRFEKAKEYTAKYKKDLLPCSYCGNTNVRIVSDRVMGPPAKDGWSVCCETERCDCTGVYTSVKAAIKRWNEKQTEALERSEGK